MTYRLKAGKIYSTEKYQKISQKQEKVNNPYEKHLEFL